MENGNEDTRKGGRAARRHGHSRSIVRLHRAPAAYAENATAVVISDDGDHVVVDVDLNGSAPVGDATEQADMKSSQGESVSDAEPDEALKAFEALMTANGIIIRSAFYYILLPSLFAMALPLLLYELLELHDRRRL